MTASIYTVRFEGKKVELPDWWAGQQEQGPASRFEPGVLIEDRRAGSEAEAWELIRASHAAGHKALAVSFYAETQDTPAGKKTRGLLAKLDRQIGTIRVNGLKSLKAGKSPKAACKHCKSALNRLFIKAVDCPLCGTEILSIKRREKVAALRTMKVALAAELQKEPPEPKKGGAVHWLVGGRAAGEQT